MEGTHYMHGDLDEIRKRLHEDGICPWVGLSTPTTISSLRIGKKNCWAVHLRRPEFDVCLKFC